MISAGMGKRFIRALALSAIMWTLAAPGLVPKVSAAATPRHEHMKAMAQNASCCPHSREKVHVEPVESYMPCGSEHRCCFRRAPAGLPVLPVQLGCSAGGAQAEASIVAGATRAGVVLPSASPSPPGRKSDLNRVLRI